MKKSALKIMVCIAVFFISLITISAITNKGNTDMTVEMNAATYPLVYINNKGEEINGLHGYSELMQVSYMRDTITPLDKNRELVFTVQNYEREIRSISIEVRSVNGERLIESTPITDYEEGKEEIKARVTLKDLIEKNEEYALIIILETDSENIRYYTRIIQAEDYHPMEKIAFVKDFHEKTFQKDESIATYLESNADGDNTTYQKVDIHCSYNQVTWGNLLVKKLSEPMISIKELQKDTALILLDYFISIEEKKYRVSEFYRVRYGKERMYLLDYERTLNSFFEAGEKTFVNNKIILGIADKNVEMQESEDGNIVAFNQGNSLYCYNTTENKCVRLFSFYNFEHDDLRDLYNKHDMKILTVEETGNVRFMTYGYMNRGRHEGKIGIQIYYYNSMLNTIEEDIFISYQKSYEILKEEMEKISYVSKNNIFYFILEGTIHSVDLANKKSEIVAENLKEDSFKVSDRNEMIVWQTGTERYNNKELILMNLNTRKQIIINAPEGSYITPLGFMDMDLIYGVADQKDILTEKSGLITFPMNRVIIQNEQNEVLKEYRQKDVYIVEGSIEENQLNLKRIKKVIEDTSFYYEPIEDFQIMNNAVKEVNKNKIEAIPTENYETIIQIALKASKKGKNLKLSEPKEVLFEGGREVVLLSPEKEMERYYVYGKNGVEGIFTEAASAINLADKMSGVVMNDAGGYAWRKGNLLAKNQIMKIKPVNTEEISSVAACLNAILECEGISRNTEYLLEKGETIYSILEKNLEKVQVLMLTGCSLESMLYYVNQDIPVMALQQDGSAVLIIGFNELNIVLMDPTTGTIYKKGMNDSKEWFTENGNRFITYVRE